MIILTGPSASGKTSIAKRLIEKYGFTKLVTSTTRLPRIGEIDGVDYHFMSKGKFIAKEAKEEFIETMCYNDNFYGTSFNDVGENKVLIVDILGANKFYEKLGNDATFFYIICNEKNTIKRMHERGDNEEDIIARINGDKQYFDINNMNHVDYIINTDVLSIDEITDDIYKKYKKIGE